MSGLNTNTGLFIKAGLLISSGLLKSNTGLYYNGLTSLFFARYFNTGTKVSETQLLDTTGNARHMTLTRRNCLLGDGTAKLTFSDLPTYDALTIVEDGTSTVKTLTALELVLTNAKKYNYAIFTNAGVEVAKFPLMEHDSDYVVNATINCYDVIGTASCVLTSGSSANISKADGLSWNFRYGFVIMDGFNIWFPKKVGVGYGGSPEGGTEYPAYSTAANQYIKAPAADAVLITRDTEEQFYDTGTPIDVHIADIYANSYVQVTGTGVVTDLKILS